MRESWLDTGRWFRISRVISPRLTFAMRLLIVLYDTYPLFRVDVVDLFCRGVARSGVSIDWVVDGEGDGPGEEVSAESGQRLFVSGPVGFGFLPRSIRRGLGHVRNQLLGLRKGFSSGYDAIQVRDLPFHAIFYLIAARLTGKRFFYWMSFPILEGVEYRARTDREELGLFGSMVRLGLAKLFRPILYRVVLRNADHVFAQSDAMRTEIAREGVPAGNITSVPMGVTTETYNPESVDAVIDPRADGKSVLVYVGETIPIRQIDILVDMLGLLASDGTDAVLFIVGEILARTTQG